MTRPPTVPTPDREVPRGVRALGYRHYRRFWLGAVLSQTGTQMQLAALAWVVAVATRSALQVSGIAFAGLLPLLVLAPVGGALADRLERRRVLLVVQTAQAGQALLLFALWEAGRASYPVLLVLSLVSGVLGGLSAPAWQSVFPGLVAPRDLPNAVMLNSTQFNVAKATGPMSAGVLIAALGPGVCFLLNAVSFLPVLWAVAAIPRIPAPPRAPGTRILGELRDGVRYARSHPGLLLAIGTNGVLAFVGAPIVQLIPILAVDVFEVEATGYGLFAGALGVGAVVGAVVLGAVDERSRPSRTLAVALLVYAVAIGALAGAPSLAVAAVVTAGIGGGYLAVVATDNSAMQTLVDDRMRGRVAALWLTVFGGLYPVGALLQGALADALGPRTVVAADAVVIAAYLLLLRTRDLLPRIDPAATTTGAGGPGPEPVPG